MLLRARFPPLSILPSPSRFHRVSHCLGSLFCIHRSPRENKEIFSPLIDCLPFSFVTPPENSIADRLSPPSSLHPARIKLDLRFLIPFGPNLFGGPRSHSTDLSVTSPPNPQSESHPVYPVWHPCQIRKSRPQGLILDPLISLNQFPWSVLPLLTCSRSPQQGDPKKESPGGGRKSHLRRAALPPTPIQASRAGLAPLSWFNSLLTSAIVVG